MAATLTAMGNQYVSMAPFMELQRRARATGASADRSSAWALNCENVLRCHMALARTTAIIAVLASSPVTTTWPGDGFDDGAGNVIPYGVEILPTGLIGSGSWNVTGQTADDVTVTVTASLLIAVGTQFIVHGCSRLPAQ